MEVALDELSLFLPAGGGGGLHVHPHVVQVSVSQTLPILPQCLHRRNSVLCKWRERYSVYAYRGRFNGMGICTLSHPPTSFFLGWGLGGGAIPLIYLSKILDLPALYYTLLVFQIVKHLEEHPL